MKTKTFINMMIIASSIVNCKGQCSGTEQSWNQDQLFPAKGGSNIFIGTGIPFAGIGEYAYGINDKFSAGVFYVKSWESIEYGVGTRLRTVLYTSHSNLRLIAELPVIYYPETSVAEAWALMKPDVMVEKKYNCGVILSAGAGLTAAMCMDALFGHEKENELTAETNHSVFLPDGSVMGGVWYTINMGITFPVAKRVTFQLRYDYVVNSIEVAGINKRDWFYKPHCIIITGFYINI